MSESPPLDTTETPRAVPGNAPSLPRRFLLVLVSPGDLFSRLRLDPIVVSTLVVGAALVALSNLLIPTAIWETAVREQLVAAGQDLPADMTMVARIGKIGAVVGALLAWPLFALAAAGVYLLLFVIGMGYEGSYRQYLSVVAHALLVPALGSLALVPLRVVTENPQFSLTLGLLVPAPEEGFLRAFVDLLDLFNLWFYALVGVGAAAVAGRRAVGGAVAAAVGLALLLSALAAALTA